MVSLLRRGTRWNIFGITTHETFTLDGGLMHFLEARWIQAFQQTLWPWKMRFGCWSRGVVNPEKVISHRFPLAEIDKAIEVMGTRERNKVVINP